MKYDVIIIGAGASGLYCALNLPKNIKTLILCKDEPWECNTFYAQGGISVARNQDDIGEHIKDTLNAGANLNDRESVEFLSKESIEVVDELLRGNLQIDRDSNGNLLYTTEGGHSKARIIHCNGDGTGRGLHTHLIANLNHTLWKGANVIDLLIDGNRCYGVNIHTKKGLSQIYANHIVIASGGVGGLFKYHTNAHTISSDLHGIAIEHNLGLKDMEMLQFHPSVFVDAPTARKPLISEAVRGEGGMIVDESGYRFLFDFDSRGELAPRDIVARAIFEYCKSGGKKAFLDLSKFTKEGFRDRFPNIFRSLSSFKIDIPNQKIPISPAFHYSMGGIGVGIDGRVLENLYAIGECANNRVHGANRLASNSLLESLVFGKRVAKEILGSSIINPQKYFTQTQEVLEKEGDTKLKGLLREIMWDKVGIVRTKRELDSALGGVEVMLESNIGRLLKLRLLTAREIIKQAIAQKESLGSHFLRD